MVEQRPQLRDRDGQVRAKEVLTVEVEEGLAHLGLAKRGTAGVAGRVPRVFVGIVKGHERAKEGRQQFVGVTTPRVVNPSGDKGGRILEEKHELLHLFGDVEGKLLRNTPFHQEKHRNVRVATSHGVQEGSRGPGDTVPIEAPIKYDTAKGRI